MKTSTSALPSPEALTPSSIAVVGMAGRFPGANSLSDFWDNLRRGVESIVTLSEEELSAAGISERVLANPAYVRRAPILDGIDEFDADFFGLAPQAARMMDPQHRLFLQCAWHALEDAGCEPAQFGGSIGVFGTATASGYLVHHILSQQDPDVVFGQGAGFDMINLSLHNDKDHVATRVSHQFDLRGPSLAVQAACSSSLVAVHLACQSLLTGECDMALAGGVSIRIPHRVGYWNEAGSIFSAAGHCRPFDVRADGTIFGSGVGVVALKPLRAALDDGDRIHAVIRGSAVNHDGAAKINYTAPNAGAQAAVIAEAHAVSGIDPSAISYVETSASGMPLGDPVEIQGLRKAFGASKVRRFEPCILGSVKSNIGHLEVASGIAGLLKAILCLKNRAIPATLHFTRPNPDLRLDPSQFVVRSEYGPWECDGVRRAGVSSLGMAGTNAHVVLEQAPAVSAPDTLPGPRVLLLSARTSEALQELRKGLATELSRADGLNLSDVASTLARRRTENVRLAALVHDAPHATRVLRAAEHDNVFVGESPPRSESSSARVAFLFPEQGAAHIGMARGLYEAESAFAVHFDQCAARFRDALDIDLRAELFEKAGSNLERTDVAQPALFAVEYALAKLAESYGLRASALAGHGIGEYVAATLAEVFDLPTAIDAVAARARLMRACAASCVVAVALGPDAIAECLSPDVHLAAINDPGTCVVTGTEEAIRNFSDRLAERQVPTRRMRTSHAFPSSSMDPILPEFEAILSGLSLGEPQIPMLSNVTGTWMSADEATNPRRWARQLRATVRFSGELDALLTHPCRVLVEVGPGGSLTASAVRHPKWSNAHRAVRLMRHQVQNRTDRDTFLLALGQLWSAGVDVDWAPLSAGRQPQLVSLPGYPFVRQKHWIEHRPAVARVSTTAPPDGRADAATGGQAQVESTLQRIWAQCLGVPSVDPNADLFELGGDSVIAISVAMNAAHEGLDLTPQDLYDYRSVAALAGALAARYAARGLARQSPSDVINLPVPPNIASFLEYGLRDAGRWRVPLILRLDSGVAVEDVRSVLTALTNHHDALRLQVVERAGTWEQHIAEQSEFGQLSTRSLPEGVAPGSPRERDAIFEMLTEQSLSSTPLTASYITGSRGGPCYLAITVHAMAVDNASRDILFTDLFTAFSQRLAGDDIVLRPATTTWREWSQRCGALAAHPAVVERRDYWLQNAKAATLRLADQQLTEPPHAGHLTRLSSTLTSAETGEVDDARRRLRLTMEEVLLAALGRTIARVIGEGVVAVDMEGAGRSVLKPDVNLGRTVGWFTTIYPVPLTCTTADTDATQLLNAIHDTLEAVPHYGIGYGLLRYVYAPTARLLAAERPADIHFSYLGAIPMLPSGGGPVQLDPDIAMPAREMLPGLGHPIELRVYRFSGTLHVDWWYDTRRLRRETAEAFVDQFPRALSELSSQVIASTDADDDAGAPIQALTLVDLSAADPG